MFEHAGAVHRALAPELPADASDSVHVFLQGQSWGLGSRSSGAVPMLSTITSIVNERGYQRAARRALGDARELIIDADGPHPEGRGLEREHCYVRANGETVSNRSVQAAIGDGRMDYFKLDGDELIADAPTSDSFFLVLLPGELQRSHAPIEFDDRGQAMLLIRQGAPAKWFSILNKSDGSRAWEGSQAALRERLQRVADSFALIDRRTPGEAILDLFNVPMSHPSARENVWRLGGAVRQARLLDR